VGKHTDTTHVELQTVVVLLAKHNINVIDVLNSVCVNEGTVHYKWFSPIPEPGKQVHHKKSEQKTKRKKKQSKELNALTG